MVLGVVEGGWGHYEHYHRPREGLQRNGDRWDGRYNVRSDLAVTYMRSGTRSISWAMILDSEGRKEERPGRGWHGRRLESEIEGDGKND